MLIVPVSGKALIGLFMGVNRLFNGWKASMLIVPVSSKALISLFMGVNRLFKGWKARRTDLDCYTPLGLSLLADLGPYSMYRIE